MLNSKGTGCRTHLSRSAQCSLSSSTCWVRTSYISQLFSPLPPPCCTAGPELCSSSRQRSGSRYSGPQLLSSLAAPVTWLINLLSLSPSIPSPLSLLSYRSPVFPLHKLPDISSHPSTLSTQHESLPSDVGNCSVTVEAEDDATAIISQVGSSCDPQAPGTPALP